MRTPQTYLSAALTPLFPILEFQRKVLLGIAELNMLLTGKSRKIYHEEGHPDRCELLDEFLQLEEILNDDEEYRTFVCSCTFLFVFIYLKCFQDREHVIFYIFRRGDFF